MKIPLLSKIALGFLTIGILWAAPHALAVPVTFSGGGGTPLSFSLAAPVTYTITTSPFAGAPLFVFQNVGPPPFNQLDSISGSITFSVNAGPPQTLFIEQSGFTAGAVTTADLFFYGTLGSPLMSVTLLS